MTRLSEIHSIDWSAVSHAYGPATDVPELLLKLARGEDFDKVTYALWGNLFHQGSTFEASGVAVPFFYAMLREGLPSPEITAFVLAYLHGLALGYPGDLFPERPAAEQWAEWLNDTDEAEIRNLSERYSTLPWGEMQEAVSTIRGYWGTKNYFVVERGIADVIPYVASEHPEVAHEAIALLSDFPRRAEDAAPALRAVLEGGGPAGARGPAVLALALLGLPWEPWATALLTDDDRSARIHAACALVLGPATLTSGSVIPDAAVEVLMQPLEELSEVESPFSNTLGAMVGAAVEHLPPSHTERAVRSLARLHEGALPMTTLQLTSQILRLAFPTPPPSDAEALTTTQRLALDAIVAHGAWTVGESRFVNYTEILRGFGLPSSRSELRAWLSEPRPLG